MATKQTNQIKDSSLEFGLLELVSEDSSLDKKLIAAGGLVGAIAGYAGTEGISGYSGALIGAACSTVITYGAVIFYRLVDNFNKNYDNHSAP